MSVRGYVIAACLVGGMTTPALSQVNEQCLACHSESSLTMEKNGKEISLHVKEDVLGRSPHAQLVCTACHTGFDPEAMPHKENMTPVNCMTCHASAPAKHRFHPQLAKATGRDTQPGMSCKGCHGTHDVIRPSDPSSKFSVRHQPATCGECHADVKNTFLASAHGRAWIDNVQGAPGCVACHQEDITKIRPGRDSAAVKVAQEQLCLACHKDNPDVRMRMSPTAGFIEAYGNSVHGKALESGNASAANCVNCHGSHEVNKGTNPASLVNRRNIVGTC